MTYALYSLAPILMCVVGILSFAGQTVRPRAVAFCAEIAALLSLGHAIWLLVKLVTLGSTTSLTLGIASLGLSARLDPISVTMTLLVAFVAWVVLRYSRNYLDGEPGQARFTGWMCLTIAAVFFLVQSGNVGQLVVAWIATSLLLNQLLVFYRDRRQAKRAARKKFVVARIGDVAIIAAGVLLVAAYGTGDITTILAAARIGDGPPLAEWAAGFLAFAAILKSAQFPAHGWLTEVMETPTPVSALLHAGLVNAGGFLLIRFADVMLFAPGVLAILVLLGGFTALFACIVMLTQPTVKTSLAWSTIAQMGFMIFQCGLTLFPLALLHIVAHSLYKAHAFLASGGAIETVASIRRPGPIAVPSGRNVGKAFMLAVGVYVVIGAAAGFIDKSPQAIALGGILIFGVAYLLAQGLADEAPGPLTKRTALYSFATALAYFGLQTAAVAVVGDSVPPTPAPGALEWALILVSLGSFGTVAVAQALFPLWTGHPAAQGLRIHFLNGFYINAILDRLLRGWVVSRRL